MRPKPKVLEYLDNVKEATTKNIAAYAKQTSSCTQSWVLSRAENCRVHIQVWELLKPPITGKLLNTHALTDLHVYLRRRWAQIYTICNFTKSAVYTVSILDAVLETIWAIPGPREREGSTRVQHEHFILSFWYGLSVWALNFVSLAGIGLGTRLSGPPGPVLVKGAFKMGW